MSLPGIGEDFSLLDTIIAELPELFYAEILPKLDLKDTCNLARVNKSYNDAVWSVDGVRSMKAKIDAYNDLNRRHDWLLPSIHVTPIFLAVRYGNLPAVKALLKSGVDVNKRVPPRIGTPLYYAALHGHVSIVALLLDAGANAREPDDWGISPLNVARASGHENIVKLLKANLKAARA
jgi:ankyrin repeat protein